MIFHNSNHPALLQWCALNANLPPDAFNPSTTRCSAMVDQDFTPIVVVAFDGWAGHRVEATIATDRTKRWGSREFISGVYRTVFETWKLNRMSMVDRKST